MKHTPLQIIYLILAVLGLILTWYYNISFFMDADDPSMSNFIALTGTTLPAQSINADIAIASFSFLIWMTIEGKRLNMKRIWGYWLVTFLVAFAFSFPLFLYFRERTLARTKA
jgi:hypothetical protein